MVDTRGTQSGCHPFAESFEPYKGPFDPHWRDKLGKTYMAADGGNYGIMIVGAIPEKSDYIVMPVASGLVQYSEQPRRRDMYKMSYRYMLKEAVSAESTDKGA